jgi:hypothetical protein
MIFFFTNRSLFYDDGTYQILLGMNQYNNYFDNKNIKYNELIFNFSVF